MHKWNVPWVLGPALNPSHHDQTNAWGEKPRSTNHRLIPTWCFMHPTKESLSPSTKNGISDPSSINLSSLNSWSTANTICYLILWLLFELRQLSQNNHHFSQILSRFVYIDFLREIDAVPFSQTFWPKCYFDPGSKKRFYSIPEALGTLLMVDLSSWGLVLVLLVLNFSPPWLR